MKKIVSIILMLSLLLTPALSSAAAFVNPFMNFGLKPDRQVSGKWHKLDESIALLIPDGLEMDIELAENGVTGWSYRTYSVQLCIISGSEGAAFYDLTMTTEGLREFLANEGATPIPLTDTLLQLALADCELYHEESDTETFAYLFFRSGSNKLHLIAARTEDDSGYDAFELVSQLRIL